MTRTTNARSSLTALALVAAVTLAGCGDDEPSSAAPSDQPTSEPTTAPTTGPTTEPTTEPTTVEPTTATPVEPSAGADPGAPADLCAIDVTEVESTMGWSVAADPAPGFSEGSCNFDFDAAEISVEYFAPPSMEALRRQTGNFDIEEIEGIGDEAFAYTSAFEITPTSAGVAAAEGEVVLQLGAFSVDEIATEDELVEGMTILARLALEANA